MIDKRPTEIGVWMKSRRTWIDIPIENKDTFALAWWSWWSALQPEARVCGAADDGHPNLTRPATNMDWKKLNKLGKNGLPLVMITLTWWGLASSGGEEWKRAVVDVCAAINCFGRSGTNLAIAPSNIPLVGSSTVNATSGRPPRERKRVWPRDEGYEEPPKKKGRR